MKVVLNTDDPVIRSFITSCLILIAKMLLMSVLTARKRILTKSFASPEDTPIGGRGSTTNANADVERIRRAHLNDVENIPLFIFAGIIYILTNPTPIIAISIFYACAICRILHTLVYAVCVVPQPARGIAWGVGFALTWYMVGASLATFCF